MGPESTVRSLEGRGATAKPQQSRAASIAAYLSDSILQLRLSAPADSKIVGQFVHGTLLFADISGFTALSERLAKYGREGAEELTARLNAYFEAMVDVVD